MPTNPPWQETIVVDQRERSFLVHLPPAATGDTSLPLVLAFHGTGINAAQMVSFCGLGSKADEEGFVVIYPNGTGRVDHARTWNAGNCCGYAMRHGIDDVGFVQAILDYALERLPIDPSRIYAAGMSSGAMLCYLLADRLSERLAAIAAIAGTMGTARCQPRYPVPVIHFHGTDDAFVPFAGGVGHRSLSRVEFHSVEHTIGNWVSANGCSPQPTVQSLPQHIDDGTQVIQTTYSGGRQGSEVVLLTIQGGGHTWPGRPGDLEFLGKTTQNISANDALWSFFRRFRRA